MARRPPLTLTLSPQAGRGDVPHAMMIGRKTGAAYPFAPQPRRRRRRADEGEDERLIRLPAKKNLGCGKRT